ncbi:MAG: arylsulfatase [Planctomycetota bacterium]
MLRVWMLAIWLGLGCSGFAQSRDAAKPPNIVFIMADDLGYGDLGCYGQERLATPNIDRLAAGGLRFTDCYAGSTVCAPSRSVLMTGLHTGHTRVRGNALVPLETEDVTVAEVLKGAGYRTGLIGKWGLGEPGSTGVPNRQGFDTFFGYLNQRHAHNYYPDYLWRNEERFELPGNVVKDGVASQKAVHVQELFMQAALDFIDRSQDEPFFLYWALTMPHANNEAGRDHGDGMEVPEYGPYAKEDWPQPEKGRAAMIHLLDRDVGRLMKHLEERGIADKTIVFFTSDNGPHSEGGSKADFFDSSGPLRGIKRALYEGGIRVPMIVRWPGHIAEGETSDFYWGFQDFLPTAAALAGAEAPQDIDGHSILPTLRGEDQKPAEYLYWEFYESGFHQAIRRGDWKAVRKNTIEAPLELYYLPSDLGEQNDVAKEQPDLVAELDALLKKARTDSEHWKVQ